MDPGQSVPSKILECGLKALSPRIMVSLVFIYPSCSLSTLLSEEWTKLIVHLLGRFLFLFLISSDSQTSHIMLFPPNGQWHLLTMPGLRQVFSISGPSLEKKQKSSPALIVTFTSQGEWVSYCALHTHLHLTMLMNSFFPINTKRTTWQVFKREK